MASRRGKRLVDPDFQLKFVGFFISFFALNVLVTLGLVNYTFSQFDKLGEAIKLPPNHILYDFLSVQQGQLNWSLVIAAVITMIITFFGGIWLSNKVAGPVGRIIKQLDEHIEEGNTDEFRIREKDFFQELPQKINKYVEKLNKSA